jgi:hypothetical protein
MSGDFIDDFHKAVNDWADHIGLEGDERDEYTAFHMEKAGYKRATTWTPPDPEEGEKGGSSMFSRRKPGAPGAKKPSKPGPPSAEQYFRR